MSMAVKHCEKTHFLKKNDILKVPEVPKKLIPEEKKPAPVLKKMEAPPPKGTLILGSTRAQTECNGCCSVSLVVLA